MINKYIYIYLNILLLLIFINTRTIYSKDKNLILKFKKNTPTVIIDNFKNNNPKSGNYKISEISGKLSSLQTKFLFSEIKFQNIYEKLFTDCGLDRIFLLKVNENEFSKAYSLLKENELVEYVESDNVIKLENISGNFIPNDTYYQNQYYLPLIGANTVWDITLGDSTVIIAVIDSGLDFTHPDLQTSYFINRGESGNGKESNGIDDDNNGFVDDWRGWNFSVSGTIQGGNNNPSDDNKFSHGTSVTGIINASINNNIGISSIAPNVKVLVIKAFDADGYGEESNVASSILYAVIMGAKVINCSFGDYIYSNLLKDIIRFAYFKNITIVCSAGNDGSFRLHYPSAFDEVISVAASDINDSKTSFSSYGQTVDIYAPGYQILTTTRVGKGNAQFETNYDYQNGTSFSAPIISASSALLLSKNKFLRNDEILGILTSTTSYLQGQSGWDNVNSSGRINILNAVQNCYNPSIVKINFPSQDYTFFGDTIPICITALSPFFNTYSLFYGIGEMPDNWIPLIQNNLYQVSNDTVLKWNVAGLQDTSFSMKLVINTNINRTIEHHNIIFKNKNAPVINDYNFGRILNKDYYSVLIQFTTDVRTIGKIYYKRKNINEPFQFIYADGAVPNIGYYSTYHYCLLSSKNLSPGTLYEFYIEALSLNGKTMTISKPEFVFNTLTQLNTYGYNKKNYSLTFSQSRNSIVDLFGNSKDNIFINEIKNNLVLNVFQFNNGTFTKMSNNNWGNSIIARDIILFPNNKFLLLCNKSRNGYIFQNSAQGQLPTVLVWSDTLNNNFWSSCFADVDNDNTKEILGFGNSGLRILKYNGTLFSEFSQLPFINQNGAEANSQNVVVGDFDGDGLNEIVFTNLVFPNQNSSIPSTAVSLFKYSGNNNFTRIYSLIVDKFIKGDNIVSGDFFGDGKKEFAIGFTSKDDDPVQYYSVYVFKYSNGTYIINNVVDIYNNKTDASVSTKSGNIDTDNKDEILVNAGNCFYILKYDLNVSDYKPVFYLDGINSVNQIIYDFDKNGTKEFGLNTVNDTLLFYEKNIIFSGPLTPLNLKGFSLDSNKINLTFDNVNGAQYYKIYRADNDSLQNYVLYDSISINNYFDTNILNNHLYNYKISAVDTTKPVKESQLTNNIKIYAHNKSKLISALYLNDGFLKLTFSQRISYNIPNLNCFILNDSNLNPVNAGINNNFEYLLSFGKRIPNRTYNIKTIGLLDFYYSPVDSNSLSFVVNQTDTSSFIAKKLDYLGNYKLKVVFNLTVDSSTALNLNNYIFEPFLQKVLSVEFDNLDKRIIYLNLEHRGLIGATGKTYILRIKNLYSNSGIKISDGAGSVIALIFKNENLDNMYVFPNPCKSGTNNFLNFAGLTPYAEINIFNLNGEFINKVIESDANGGVIWDLKDTKNNLVPSGVYIFRATGKNSNGIDVNEKIGKFVIIK
jgi:hypothetical protein